LISTIAEGSGVRTGIGVGVDVDEIAGVGVGVWVGVGVFGIGVGEAGAGVFVGVAVGSGEGVGLVVGVGEGVGVDKGLPITISTPINSRRTSSDAILAIVCLVNSREKDRFVTVSSAPATNVIFAITNVASGGPGTNVPAAISISPLALSKLLNSGIDNGEAASKDSSVTCRNEASKSMNACTPATGWPLGSI
jgi:hypothetical protein